MRSSYFIFPLAAFLFSVVCFSQNDTLILQKLKQEAFDHSQIMTIAHYLTDVSGPRLTNSPGYEKASEWAANTLRSWGLINVHLEPWGNFGPGWAIQKNYAAIIVPYYHAITAFPLAWTKGTGGLIKAEVLQIPALDPDAVKKLGASVKGKIVLPLQTDSVLRSDFEPDALRYTNESLQQVTDHSLIHEDEIKGMVGFLSNLKEAIRLLQQQGCAGVLNMSAGDRDGTINASAWFSGKKGVSPELTTLNINPEDYLSIQRLLETGNKVEMEMDIQTATNNNETAYNVTGEIPGTDPVLKNEIVMIGAHLDSWYSATGATDNAAGCAVMMEVIRMFEALHIQPKRTIRIALWSGEEQGLLGSHAYVQKHFADITNMKPQPEYERISAYYNLDNGTGKIRGLYLEHNDSVKNIFEEWIQPLADSGVTKLSMGSEGSTDHVSFDAVGIPAFEFIQDPIDYETRTHHTNMDDFDHLLPSDLKQAATVVAWFVYNTAMRNEKLPRKQIPAPHSWLFDSFKP